MATTTGWLGEQAVFYIQSGTYSTWIASNVYISSATHSGNTVTVSGTIKLYIRCSWSSSSPVAYYGDPITVTPRGGSAIEIKGWTSTTSMDFYKDQEIGSVDFTTSYTESASSTTSTFSVYYKDTRRDDWVNTTLSWSTSVDPGYTAPSTPTVTIGTKSVNSIAVTYGTSSFGYPSSGNVYLYGGTSSSPTTQITSKTTTGNSSYTNGSLASNTKYYYRSRANNGQMNSGYSTEKTAVTLAASPTVSVGSISGDDATINYSTVADGGFYDKTIEYSTDGGTTWQTGVTVTGGSAQTGSFVIDNLPSGENSVQIRTTTTSGSDTPITITIQISPGGVALYGSVNGASKKVQKLYGSVNGQTKTILKVYGSVGGVSKLVYELPAYGIVTFYTDSGHTTTDTAVLKSQADVNLLTGGSYSATWSATIDGKTVTSDNIKGISLTSMVSRLPEYFLCNSVVLDSLDISQTKLVSTPTGFMRGCVIFNQNVVFPSTLRTIGNTNFCGCSVFNSNINIGNVTEIGTSFLGDCFEFNKPLDTSNATFINSGFLRCGSASNVMKFNQPLNLGKLQTLGASFLNRCRCFNQDITLPASLTYIGSSFLEDMRDMSHTVYCNTSTVPAKSSSNKQYSLSTYGNDYASAASYQSGIKLGGTYKNEWKAECPDCSGTDNLYRKTVLV